MTIEQTIEELRAELKNAVDAKERRRIETELAAAVEQHTSKEAAFDAMLEAEPPH